MKCDVCDGDTLIEEFAVIDEIVYRLRKCTGCGRKIYTEEYVLRSKGLEEHITSDPEAICAIGNKLIGRRAL